jgi:hypothetical protein
MRAASRRPRRFRLALAATAVVMAAVGQLVSFRPPSSVQAMTGVVDAHHRIAAVTIRTHSKNPAYSIGDFPRLRRDGVTMITMDVHWVVDPATFKLAPEAGDTATDADIIKTTEAAEANGLDVALQPTFELGQWYWRGAYYPADVRGFFRQYQGEIDHYADLAEAHHIKLFYVGTEMNSLQPYVAEWRGLIAEVRRHYHGELTYNANWDIWRDVDFWDRLDVISMSAYMPLTDAQYPSVADFKGGWSQYLPDMAFLSQKWGKPIFFGEAGYVPAPQAGKRPCCMPNTPHDAQFQANGYEALVETFRAQPWWLGVNWWAWNDGTFAMGGGPAERFLNVELYAPLGPSAAGTAASSGSSSHMPQLIAATAGGAVILGMFLWSGRRRRRHVHLRGQGVTLETLRERDVVQRR